MKYTFLAIFALLLIVSGVTALMMPQRQNSKPVIYWVTDPNPARLEQIDLFHHWMIEHGHTAPDGTSAVELHLDTANNDPTKKIIQSVSGVGGDVMDLYGGGEMRYFQSMGVLEDVTRDALALGFGPDQTYSAARSEIMFDGRQYVFPCNVTAGGYWVNRTGRHDPAALALEPGRV